MSTTLHSERPRSSDQARRRDPDYIVWLAVAVVGYVVLLHVSYKELVAPELGYQGFTYRSPDLLSYAGAIGVVVLLAVILPARIGRVSDFIQWVLFATAGAPSILVTQYADILPVGDSLLVGLHVSVCTVLLRVVSSARPKIHLNRSWIGFERFFLPTVLMVVVGALGYLAAAGLLSLRALAFDDVYTVRAEVGLATQGDAIVGYLIPTVHKVLGPLLVGCGLWLRRPSLFVVGALTQYICYASLGSKTIIIAVVGIGLLYLLFRRSEAPRGSRLLGGLTLGLTIPVLIDMLRGSTTLTFFTIRRLEVVPGVLTSAYVKVFDEAPKVNFADSLLFFLDSPYERSAQLIVGDYFLGNDESNASVNLWGDGFANYGFIGMYVATLVLGVLLWVADDVSADLPMFISCSIMLMPTAAVGEASVFTLMLTHGFVVGILACALIPRTWLTQGRKRRSASSTLGR